MTETPLPDGRVAKWILLLTLLLALAARLAAGQEVGAGLYEKARQASVEILVDDHLDGSGWFADTKGMVFTAAHVIGRPGRRIEILSPAAGRLEAAPSGSIARQSTGQTATQVAQPMQMV